MAYTVKQLAALSGVSVRTLHFYDETGLLKPAYHGANGYRYYEEAQLLMLQQILFYRELGMELKRVKRIIGKPDFEKLAALESHRTILVQNLARTGELIGTIDKTIKHLKGTEIMKSEEMFAGFSVAAGESRSGEEITLGGEPIDCKVSGKDTNGGIAVFEFNGSGGGPRHLHHEQDEWLYIMEGEFHFEVGDRHFRAVAGESVFVPRKVPHAWGCVSGVPGKVINVYQPAGKMEEFFREVGRPFEDLPTAEQVLNKTYTEHQVKSLHALFSAHGMELLGPPPECGENR